MIAIDLGHRFGRVGRIGPDGLPDVATTELDGTDGVLDPQRALPGLLGSAPAEPDRRAVLGIPATGGGEDELRRAASQSSPPSRRLWVRTTWTVRSGLMARRVRSRVVAPWSQTRTAWSTPSATAP
jgi:hypothetical protein